MSTRGQWLRVLLVHLRPHWSEIDFTSSSKALGNAVRSLALAKWLHHPAHFLSAFRSEISLSRFARLSESLRQKKQNSEVGNILKWRED